MFYFKIFPQVQYSTGSNVKINSVDITKRFKFIDNLLKNKYIFYTYNVKDGERADIVADKYYGDDRLDWLIWMMNSILDPYFQWPLSYEEFQEYMIKKFGSIEEAMSTTAKYYKIIQDEEVLFDGTKVPKRVIEIDEQQFLNTPFEDRESYSFYEIEKAINDERKNIKLIDKTYLSQIKNELESILQ